MELIEYPDAEMMMMQLANKLAGALRQALSTHDSVSFAVPGGTTPGPVFDSLCAADLDWSRVHIMLTDERWVPESDPRSNTRLLRERLLVERAAAAMLIPLHAEGTPEEALPGLRERLAAELPLSLCLLGMGADMHTASLFPGADNLDTALTGDETLMVMRAPGVPDPRITLTASVLNDAMSRHLLIIGEEKRAALERATDLDPTEAPVAAILKETIVHWARE